VFSTSHTGARDTKLEQKAFGYHPAYTHSHAKTKRITMPHLDALFVYLWCFAGLITALKARESFKSKIAMWEWIMFWAGWPGVALVLIYYGLQKKI